MFHALLAIESRESMILVKAKKNNFKAIENKIKRLHNYKVPEIIAIPIIAGSKEYLGWINKETA